MLKTELRAEISGPEVLVHMIETDTSRPKIEIVGQEYRFNSRTTETIRIRNVRGKIEAKLTKENTDA